MNDAWQLSGYSQSAKAPAAMSARREILRQLREARAPCRGVGDSPRRPRRTAVKSAAAPRPGPEISEPKPSADEPQTLSLSLFPCLLCICLVGKAESWSSGLRQCPRFTQLATPSPNRTRIALRCAAQAMSFAICQHDGPAHFGAQVQEHRTPCDVKIKAKEGSRTWHGLRACPRPRRRWLLPRAHEQQLPRHQTSEFPVSCRLRIQGFTRLLLEGLPGPSDGAVLHLASVAS